MTFTNYQLRVLSKFVNVCGLIWSTLRCVLPPSGPVFSETFVSPNGPWNILHMIRDSNKMNNNLSPTSGSFL